MANPISRQHATHTLVSSFDQTLARWVSYLPHWLEPMMKAATLIGQPVVVIAVGCMVAIVAWLKNFPRIAYAQIAALAAFGVNTLIKNIVHRTRPDTIYSHHMKIKSYSFPSGHAFGSAVFYGLLAYLAYTRLPQPWNIVTAVMLVFLIFIIGLSRVYLGAHFPSDVLMGWLLGVLSLILIVKYLKP